MLAKDLRSDRMESVKGEGNWIIQDSVKKKENENTDRAKYFNLIPVVAQSILSTSHKPLPSTHRELKQNPLTFAILGSRNKRPKELEIREHR